MKLRCAAESLKIEWDIFVVATYVLYRSGHAFFRVAAERESSKIG